MDESERAQFRSMFRGCVLLMNVFLISGACSILFVIIPCVTGKAALWTWIVVGLCAAVFVVSLYFFIRKYKSTKTWLNIHGTTKAERQAQAEADLAAQRKQIRCEMLEEVCGDLKKEIGELTVKQASAASDDERAALQKEIDVKVAELKSYEEKLALEG